MISFTQKYDLHLFNFNYFFKLELQSFCLKNCLLVIELAITNFSSSIYSSHRRTKKTSHFIFSLFVISLLIENEKMCQIQKVGRRRYTTLLCQNDDLLSAWQLS